MSTQETVKSQDAESRGKVLVVDDSRVVRAVVGHMLKKGGFQVEEADGGPTALRLLRSGRHDVVITDLNMPGLDGFEVLAAVKRLDPNVEVIILTGSMAQDVTSAVKALRLGAHDYLTKSPANVDEVILTVARAVESKRLKEANQRLVRELQTLSQTDALTGVPNRRAFDEALAREIARARRHGQPLGMVLLDIDRFKRINDTYGHQTGDQVLHSFARAVASSLREGDTLYRYGGEEFAVILPSTGLTGATKAAARIVAVVAGRSIQVGASAVRMTASAGVACLSATQDQAKLVAEADAALYEAKSNGRNRAVARGRRLALVAEGRTA